MNNKTWNIILGFLAGGLIIFNFGYALYVVSSTKQGEFPYSMALFILVGIATLSSFTWLAVRIKKLDSKFGLPILVIILVSVYFLNKWFGGASVGIENMWIGVFYEPLMWLLIITLIGHLILSVYNRNNRQIN